MTEILPITLDLRWLDACSINELEVDWGEAVLFETHQIALFRLDDRTVYATDHSDPRTGASVMARGIIGSRGDRLTVASPLHKDVYCLLTGECLSREDLALRTYPVRLAEDQIQIGLS